MKFEDYGTLEWLEPEDFYADAWRIIDPMVKAEDGELYTIVLLKVKDDADIIRYTTI